MTRTIHDTESSARGLDLAAQVSADVQESLLALLADFADDGEQSGVMEGVLHAFVSVAFTMRQQNPELEAALPLRQLIGEQVDAYLTFLETGMGPTQGNA